MATKIKEASKRAPKRNYPDLHDHLKALDDAGLLVTVDRKINKDCAYTKKLIKTKIFK